MSRRHSLNSHENPKSFTIAVTTTDPTQEGYAKNLANSLHLPFTYGPQGYNYLLIITPKYLCLRKANSKLQPLYVDFLSGKLTYRRQNASLRNEALARALGLKHHTNPKIIDATAGLARDSFILASLGFEVQLLERSPIIHALVEDGLNRAAQNPHVAPIAGRLHLVQTDAITWLNKLTKIERPNIIYLDPMFPERQKSALVKKEMQIFQEVIGEDTDAEDLLTAALTCATERVVVKRPRLAPALGLPSPSFNLTGSSSRFDVYLTKEHHGNNPPHS